MINTNITKDDITRLPLLKFSGEIILAETEESIEEVMDTLLQYKFVGFDTETKPSFKKGQYNPLALLQFAVDNKAYLIRVKKTGITKKIIDFIADPDIMKIGVALDDEAGSHDELRKDAGDERFLEIWRRLLTNAFNRRAAALVQTGSPGPQSMSRNSRFHSRTRSSGAVTSRTPFRYADQVDPLSTLLFKIRS